MTADHAGERRKPWPPVYDADADVALDDAAGAEPLAAAPPDAAPAAPPPVPGLTPAKPVVPSWIVREQAPVPVDPEPDEQEFTPPVPPPPADEVLPHVDRAAPSGPPVSPYDNPPAGGAGNAVHLLGAGAITSATLSAAGAPTPLGGVPVVPAADAVESPSFGDDEPTFTPRFEGANAGDNPAPASGNDTGDDAESSPVAGLEPATLELNASDEYHPRYQPPTEPPEDETADDEPPHGRRWWWLLAVLALIVVGAIAWLIWGDSFKAEPQVVPGPVVTVEPPQPSGEPIVIESPTPLLAAMPGTVGQYVLTGAEPLEPANVALDYGRVASAAQTTYSDGTHEISVLALQYYDEDAAIAAWTDLVGEDVPGEPVMAGGTEVGRSAGVTQPEPGIVWRNGTTVLIATGPPLELEGFFDAFGL